VEVTKSELGVTFVQCRLPVAEFRNKYQAAEIRFNSAYVCNTALPFPCGFGVEELYKGTPAKPLFG
jgi:hypothetical protein